MSSQGGADNEAGWARFYAEEEARKRWAERPALPFALIIELLETRTKDAVRGEPIYVEDELYDEYDRRLTMHSKYKAVEHPEPNLLFGGSAVIRPMSSKPKYTCGECGRPL